MTEQQPPTRLKHDPDCGKYLLADSEPFPAQRLADGAAALQTRIAEGAALGSGLSLSRWLKAGLGLAVLLGLSTWGLSLRKEAALDHKAGASESTRALAPPAPVAQEPAGNEAAPVEQPAVAEPQGKPAPAKRVTKRHGRQQPVPTPSEPAAAEQPEPPEQGDLREQVRLFEQARAAARQKKYDKASEILDDLLARFPNSPLGPDAMLSRLEYLVRSEQTVAALRLATHLANQPEHAGRRGELLRVAGDLARKLDDCESARRAYTQAQKLARGAHETQAIVQGLDKCEGR